MIDTQPEARYIYIISKYAIEYPTINLNESDNKINIRNKKKLKLDRIM